MNKDLMRKQFEDFAIKRNAQLIAEGHSPNSAFMIKTLHYPIWVESRAAVVVDLGEPMTDSTGYRLYLPKYVKKAIEAAGLKVQP